MAPPLYLLAKLQWGQFVVGVCGYEFARKVSIHGTYSNISEGITLVPSRGSQCSCKAHMPTYIISNIHIPKRKLHTDLQAFCFQENVLPTSHREN